MGHPTGGPPPNSLMGPPVGGPPSGLPMGPPTGGPPPNSQMGPPTGGPPSVSPGPGMGYSTGPPMGPPTGRSQGPPTTSYSGPPTMGRMGQFNSPPPAMGPGMTPPPNSMSFGQSPPGPGGIGPPRLGGNAPGGPPGSPGLVQQQPKGRIDPDHMPNPVSVVKKGSVKFFLVGVCGCLFLFHCIFPGRSNEARSGAERKCALLYFLSRLGSAPGYYRIHSH